MPSRVEFIRSLPYFAGLDAATLERVARETQELTFDRGQVLFLENDPCRGLYVVREGLVRVFKTSPEGREQVMSIAGPGDSFNAVPVFDGGPNPATATALEKTDVLLVPGETFQTLTAACPAAAAIIRMLAGHLRRATTMVEDLSFRTVVSRLAKLLLDLAAGESGPPPAPPLTQEEMAARVGSVRDVVGRGLRQLEKQGAIKMAQNRLLVVDADRLRQMAE
jgi:CRP/FNR family cyclic AMP-dependent transcriptional regulator